MERSGAAVVRPEFTLRLRIVGMFLFLTRQDSDERDLNTRFCEHKPSAAVRAQVLPSTAGGGEAGAEGCFVSCEVTKDRVTMSADVFIREELTTRFQNLFPPKQKNVFKAANIHVSETS